MGVEILIYTIAWENWMRAEKCPISAPFHVFLETKIGTPINYTPLDSSSKYRLIGVVRSFYLHLVEGGGGKCSFSENFEKITFSTTIHQVEVETSNHFYSPAFFISFPAVYSLWGYLFSFPKKHRGRNLPILSPHTIFPSNGVKIRVNQEWHRSSLFSTY